MVPAGRPAEWGPRPLSDGRTVSRQDEGVPHLIGGAVLERFSGGFFPRGRKHGPPGRLPPGQYLTDGFPGLLGPGNAQMNLDEWRFSVEQGEQVLASWSWKELQGLPAQDFLVDIHCVTRWSKLDTHWRGVSVDTLLAGLPLDPQRQYVVAYCYGGYTTNLPLAEITGGRAFVAYEFDGQPLSPRARLASPPGGARPLPVEERQVGPGPAPPAPG